MSKQDHTGGKVPGQGAAASPKDGADGKTAPEGEESGDRDLNLGAIGSQLRGLYKELLDEPIPDRFVELLDNLEGKESGKK